MADKQRPDPEELLEAVQKIESKRGRLRLFLGMCPGVGKTYSMLKAAKEQTQRGVRVIVGVAETHGRKDTQEILAGLTLLPKKEVFYKDTKIAEMDLDGILQARPGLVLVDELAHSNAPGSRHAKRFQDVEEILSAGIDVYSTLNIQHIESRNDQVAQITGVQVRETVPDSFLESAAQIELVDLSPAELLHRMKEGKVYLGEGAELAAKNFFKEEHLTALRELALRFTAEKVDQDLHEQMLVKGIEGPWNTNERLLVAVSFSPYALRLIRATRRMAYNLEAPWVALYVDTGAALSKEDQAHLQQNLDLARELGAEVVSVSGTDVVSTIQRICAEKNVTQIVMGRPDRRFFRDFFSRGTLLDQLVRTTSKIDVHVIRAERMPRYTGFHLEWPASRSSWQAYYNTGWFLALVSFLCYGLLPIAGYRALGSVFLLAILTVASFASRGPILLSAFVCALVWNFFFIPPAFTFSISLGEDIAMVVSFFVTGLVGGLLTSRIRRQEVILQNREQRTRLLYELSQNLAEAKNQDEIESGLASIVDKQFGGACTVFFLKKDGKIDWSAGHGKQLAEKEIAVAQWSFENNKPAGWSTQTLAGASCLCLPMRGKRSVVGILAFVPMKSERDFSAEKESFLETVLSQAAIAFERFRFSEAAENARLFEASEALHQTLLNSVSHELRTPITAIIGSATALKDEKTLLDSVARNSLADELVRSGLRLDRVVENLLDISRLQKGSMQLKREWFYAEDLFQEVSLDLKEELKGRELIFTGSLSSLMEGDFGLLKHAFANLLLNALKYSGSGAIEIESLAEPRYLSFRVKDRGPGIPEESREALFEKFYRLPGTPAGGLGLGLHIVRSIVDLHGGTIHALNRQDGPGAIFELRLPRKELPAELGTFA